MSFNSNLLIPTSVYIYIYFIPIQMLMLPWQQNISRITTLLNRFMLVLMKTWLVNVIL